MGRSPREFAGAAALLVTLTIARSSSAGEDQAALATDPVTISEIEHDDLHVAVDSWGAFMTSSGDLGARDVAAWTQHVRVESPLGSRSYYFHIEYQAGSATSTSYGGSKILGGNAIVGGRAVWSHPQGIAFGGDLGFGLPTAKFGSSVADDVSLVLATMRPWDYDAFRSSAFVFMPAIDVRAVFRIVTLQLRQQLDWAIETRHAPRSNLSTITTLYAGVRVHPAISPGIEASELYLIDPSVPDDRRSFTALAPGVRFNLGRMSPEVGVLTNVGQPVHPSLDRVWAVRASCTFSFEPTVLTP
jgi:hypothetical protein